MALGTQSTVVGGATKNLVVAVDSAGSIAAGHVIVGADGLEKGTVGNPLSMSGSFTIAGTVAVTGTFWQATQPISGAVSVSNLPTTQAVSGTGATGSAPVNPPLSISGVDGSGNKQHVLLDTAGRQQVAWGAGIATNQVTVDTTAGGKLIVPARVGRRSVIIVQEGTTLVRLGAPGLTMSNGIPLPGIQYASLSLDGGAAIYGTVASGTQSVSYMEFF